MPSYRAGEITSKKPYPDAVSYFSGTADQFGSYYDSSPEFQERCRIWQQLLDQYSVPNGRAIDVGCGTGIFTFYLASKGIDVVGVDAAKGMLATAAKRKAELGLSNVEFVEAMLPHLDPGSVPPSDLLISSSVIEYVADLDETLRLFSKLVKPNAAIVVSMPNMWSLSRLHQRLKRSLNGDDAYMPFEFVRHFSSPGSFSSRLSQFGFRVEQAHYYTHRTRLARLARKLRLPAFLTADLFVIAGRRSGPG